MERATINEAAVFFAWSLVHQGVSAANIVKLCEPVQAIIDDFGGSVALENITADRWAEFFRGPRLRLNAKGTPRPESEFKARTTSVVEWLALLLQKRVISTINLPPDLLARIDGVILRRAKLKVLTAPGDVGTD